MPNTSLTHLIDNLERIGQDTTNRLPAFDRIIIRRAANTLAASLGDNPMLLPAVDNMLAQAEADMDNRPPHPCWQEPAFTPFMLAVAAGVKSFNRGWDFSFEYPGYLSYYQQVDDDPNSDNNLEIVMGFDLESHSTWRVDYVRAGVVTASWSITDPDMDPIALAARIVAGLDTFTGDE
jgi:hypothetical protein